MKYIAVITGASSGIGREFACFIDRYLKSIDELWIVARRRDRLEELSASLRHHCRIICGDLSDESLTEQIVSDIISERARVRFLINASGYGILGDFSDGERKEETGMCDINVTALTRLTHACIPYMSSGSRIINMASSAAFLPQAKFSVYAATKSYVLSFSRSLNAELAGRGIYVTAVCPGPVKTEFFDTAEKNGTATLALKKFAMTTPEKVVKCAMRDSYLKKDISVPTVMMKLFFVFTKIVPHSVIIRAVSGLYR